MTFYEAVTKIQTELKAPKNRQNNFGNYKYRSCEDILEAVKPLLKELGLVLTLTDRPVEMGGWHYIEATATVTNGKESFTATAVARESETKKGMDDSQISGTASSYARKYALNGLFLIDDAKDSDTDEVAGTDLNAHSLKAIKERVQRAITAKMDEGFTLEEIAVKTGIGSSADDVRDIARYCVKISEFETKLAQVSKKK